MLYIKNMAITESAKKAIRQSARRKENNLLHSNRVKKLIKELRVLALGKKTSEAKKLLPKVYSAIDKAAKVGVIKKNNASRKKSRLTRLVEKGS